MHSQDPRTKTALAPSTVRIGDGAAASCCPARERSKRRRPSNPDDRLIAATLKPSMPLESFIVRSAATLAQGVAKLMFGCPITRIQELVGTSLFRGSRPHAVVNVFVHWYIRAMRPPTFTELLLIFCLALFILGPKRFPPFSR